MPCKPADIGCYPQGGLCQPGCLRRPALLLKRVMAYGDGNDITGRNAAQAVWQMVVPELRICVEQGGEEEGAGLRRMARRAEAAPRRWRWSCGSAGRRLLLAGAAHAAHGRHRQGAARAPAPPRTPACGALAQIIMLQCTAMQRGWRGLIDRISVRLDGCLADGDR